MATTLEDELIIGLVSISDRASGGVYEDQGIPALESWLAAALRTPYRLEKRLIPDERSQIENTLIDMVDLNHCHLILTTGGTGPARRDVTPDATLSVGTKEMPGFGEQMRQISLQFVPTAILSRQVAVIRETPERACLIMNLPGQPKAIKETLEGLKDADGKQLVNGIFAAVPYCIDLIGGPYMETDPAICKAFRPKSALRPAQPLPEENTMSTLLETIELDSAPDTTVSIIWMHGLGADNNDFVPLVKELDLRGCPAIRFIFPNAGTMPVTINNGYVMRSWYDIRSNDLVRREDEGRPARLAGADRSADRARKSARHPRQPHHSGRLLARLRHDPANGLAPPGNTGRPDVPVRLSAAGRQDGRRAHARQPANADLHGARHGRPGGADRPRRTVARLADRHGLPGGMACLPHAAFAVPGRNRRDRRLAEKSAGLK